MPNAEFAGIGVRAREHEEGQITKRIEQFTSQVPSGLYLATAIGSMGVSLTLHLLGKKHQALFIGQWAPAFLLMGLYNKIVKLEGSD